MRTGKMKKKICNFVNIDIFAINITQKESRAFAINNIKLNLNSGE